MLLVFLFVPSAKSESLENPPNFGNSARSSLTIENVQQEVMEPCRDQYINNEGLSVKERENLMIDCLVTRSHASQQASVDYSIATQTQSPLPTKFGLQPPSQQELLKNSLGGPLGLNTLQVQIHADDNGYSGDIEFDAVIPLESEPTQDSALFGEVGFILSIRDKNNPESLSAEDNFFQAGAGLVYRFVASNGVLGFNLFYDRSWGLEDRSIQHDRLTTGVDYQSGRDILSFNYYYPLSDWVDIHDYYEERAVGGVDLNWRKLVTEKWESSTGISSEDYKRDKNQFIFSAGMDYKVDCWQSVGFGAERNLNTSKTKAFVSYNVTLGDSYSGQDCLYNPYENEKFALYRPVERRKTIALERGRESPQLNIPDQSIVAGELFSYKITPQNFRYVKSEESPRITITSLPQGISYNSYSQTFTGTIMRPGSYTIRGIVSLATAGQSRFSFNLLVRKNQTQEPSNEGSDANLNKESEKQAPGTPNNPPSNKQSS